MFDYFRNYSNTFAVKIVRLKVYRISFSPMTLTFIQGYKCVSNLTFINLQYLGQYLTYYIHTWHDDSLHGYNI